MFVIRAIVDHRHPPTLLAAVRAHPLPRPTVHVGNDGGGAHLPVVLEHDAAVEVRGVNGGEHRPACCASAGSVDAAPPGAPAAIAPVSGSTAPGPRPQASTDTTGRCPCGRRGCRP